MVGVAMAGGMPSPPPAPPEPPAWLAEYGRVAVAMPVDVIASLASPDELGAAAGDSARIERLTASLGAYGPHMPLLVNVDGTGRIVLADGHHRVHAARAAQLGTLPVQIKPVGKIGGWSTSVAPVLGSLVRGDR